MDLKDEVMKKLNSVFKRSTLDIKLEDLFLFRPVVKELPFEKMEVIRDATRALYCDPICAVFLIDFHGRRLEYEAKFNNNEGELSLASYTLRYCDYFPDEDPKKIGEEMAKSREILLIIMAILTVLNACMSSEARD